MRHMDRRKGKQWCDWYMGKRMSSVKRKLERDWDGREKLSCRDRCDVFCYCHLPLEHCCQVTRKWITTGSSHEWGVSAALSFPSHVSNFDLNKGDRDIVHTHTYTQTRLYTHVQGTPSCFAYLEISLKRCRQNPHRLFNPICQRLCTHSLPLHRALDNSPPITCKPMKPRSGIQDFKTTSV